MGGRVKYHRVGECIAVKSYRDYQGILSLTIFTAWIVKSETGRPETGS